jgi:glycosyltransferase involved in cell wall biosynthesis
MDKIKVSIIIPIYNTEKFLSQCLDSVLNQTLNEIEIICVNDGSTDNSPQILEEYSKKDKRIKIIDRENAGPGAARNTGIGCAKGEYIGFVDSDDWIDASMYEKLYNNAKFHKSDMVMCPIELFNESDCKLKHNLSYFALECFDESFDDCVFDYKKTKDFIFSISVTTFNKIYKTEFIKNIDAKFPEGLIFEDNSFFYQTYLMASKISLIRDFLYFYRVNRPDSIMSSPNKNFFDVIEIENQTIKNFLSLSNTQEYKMALINVKIYRVIVRYFEVADIHRKEFFELIKKDFKKMNLRNELDKLNVPMKKHYLNVINSDSYKEFERRENKDKTREGKLFRISIIVPVYNVQEYIVEALESIVRQTIGLENLEIIMVNDCSTDQSGKIMDKYSTKYENFKAIHLTENSGNAGKPRNVGIENATGEYIMFLDPDDFYSDDMCETLYNKIVIENIDLVFCNFNLYYPNGTLEKSYLPSFGNLDEIKIETIDENPKFLDIYRLWTIIFKQDYISEKNIRFSEDILAEDRLFLLETFLEAKGIIYLQNYFGTNYRIRSHLEKDSLSNATSKKALVDRVKGYQKAYDILKCYKKEEFLPYALNVREFWADRFIKSDLSSPEKKEILKQIIFLFKEYEKFEIKPYKNYMPPLFDHIVKERFDEAIILANVLKDLINKQKQLQNEKCETLEEGNVSVEFKELVQNIERLKSQNNYLEDLIGAYKSRKVVRVADKILSVIYFLKSYFAGVFIKKSSGTQNDHNQNDGYYHNKTKLNSEQPIVDHVIDVADSELTSKKDRYASELHKTRPKKLEDIKIAVIFDEFTYKSFKYEFNAIPIEPSNWFEIFEKEKPDLFLCESAWQGIDSEKMPWKRKIYVDPYSKSENRTILLDILRYCNKHYIPSIFWNKEDPTDFRIFHDTALKFDHIFTTTEECIQRYKECGHKSVHCLMFAAQPKLFNPIEKQERSDDIVFAGSWYNRFPHRSRDMGEIFDHILDSGFKLKIYDRNYHLNDPQRTFPDKYDEFINPPIPFNQIEKVYKESKYALSINTINKSNSMFSRRVFELMLCNTLVLSNYSKGMIKIFGDNVIIIGEDNIDLFNEDEKRINNLYNVLKNHTYKNRFKQMLDDINYKYLYCNDNITIYYVVNDQFEIENILEHYNSITYKFKKLVILLSDHISDPIIDDIRQKYGNNEISFYSLKNLRSQNEIISNYTTYFVFADVKLENDFIEKAILHYSYIKTKYGIVLGDKFAFKEYRDLSNVVLPNEHFRNALEKIKNEDIGDFLVYTIQI